MAQEFKDFDKMFTGRQIGLCRAQWLRGFDHQAEPITKWEIPLSTWDNDTIRNAVYFAEGFEEWQLFRVSMKGLTTEEKLYMCSQRYNGLDRQHIGDAKFAIEKCRIDNYILALKRGGLLNAKLEIVR